MHVVITINRHKRNSKLNTTIKRQKTIFILLQNVIFVVGKRATLAEGKSWVFLSLAWNIWSECEHNKSFPRNEILK